VPDRQGPRLKGAFAARPEFLEHVARHSSGDARGDLGAGGRGGAGPAERRDVLEAHDAEEALQQKTLLYDKSGDAHYDTISAFIKSLRGSDPDAAAYYLVRMLESGEEPRFLLRRMVIFAAEDIGNAEPRALSVRGRCAARLRAGGVPEGVLPMTQAAVFPRHLPKSNSTLTTYSNARKAVVEHGPLPVPLKLRNAPTPLMKSMGYSGGYRYPHNFSGNYVPEEYLPDALRGQRFYEPGTSGEDRRSGAAGALARRARRAAPGGRSGGRVGRGRRALSRQVDLSVAGSDGLLMMSGVQAWSQARARIGILLRDRSCSWPASPCCAARTGDPLIIAGLALLGTQFTWARRASAWLRERFNAAIAALRRRASPQA